MIVVPRRVSFLIRYILKCKDSVSWLARPQRSDCILLELNLSNEDLRFLIFREFTIDMRNVQNPCDIP